MALVTTFATTPLVQGLYPLWYQKKLESWKRGEIDWEGHPLRSSSDTHSEATTSIEKLQSSPVTKLLVYLRLESLPSLFTLITLLGGEKPSPVAKIHPNKLVAAKETNEDQTGTATRPKKPLEVHGLRLLPLTERTSSVMRVSSTTTGVITDPVVNAFRAFAGLIDLAVSGGISIVPESSFANEITTKADDLNTDLVVIPWAENGAVSEGDSSYGGNSAGDFNDAAQASFVRQALDEARCNAVVLVNAGFGGPGAMSGNRDEGRTLMKTTSHISTVSLRDRHFADLSRTVADRSHHIFFPFLGGSDDKVALRFVLLLAKNSNVTATILHVRRDQDGNGSTIQHMEKVATDSGDKSKTTTTAEDQDRDVTFLHSLRDSLPTTMAERVVFSEISAALSSTKAVMETVIETAKAEVNQSPRNAGDLIVVGRHHDETSSYNEVAKALGVLAEGVLGGVRCSVLVVQAAGGSGRGRRESNVDEIRFAR